MEYRVLWSIDIDAENEEDAAKEALEIMRDPASTANFFDVMEAHPETLDWLDNVLDEFTVPVEAA